ncbi:hypothetical protein KC19_4G092400 [Ceratodon purpureus]|uniref:DUF4005 domain-containing protein n=1 Tax=Ceratodon purpureus TaxID=3225 RepID=A0A8T0I8F6_CERPU|nr:hypothetical protein KC19_4G092400 [Ceratodon purpureus]
MGKSTKPTKWFKAVKKAFRSPSKERPPSAENTKADADEKLFTKHDFPPVTHQAPTPHPLPLFEIISHEVGSERIRGQPLPTPEAVLDPAISAVSPKREEKEVEKEDVNASNNVLPMAETHQDDDDDDDSTLSEEEEAATRIQQRFDSPLALKGLIRLQALVRGYLVRRQAATTLRTMEAIVRVQAVFRGRRVRMSKDGRVVRSRISRARRHSSRNGAVYGDKQEPLGSEVVQEEANIRKRPTAYLLTQQLKRNTPNQSSSFIDCDPDQPHEGWAWLELWTNARPWENTRQVEVSKDYIEIIPGSRRNSQYTTKEVDVNTKVKYYEDYISDLAPKKTSFSSRLVLEKKERECIDVSEWQRAPQTPSPVQTSAPAGPSTLTAHNHRALSKPPPIEVPDTEEVEATQKLSTPDSVQKQPELTPLSPALSEGDASHSSIAPSPQASDAALLSVPETPPGQLISSGDIHDPSATTMEQLVLPEAHMRTNEGDANEVSMTHSDSLSVSNAVHQPGEDTPSPKGSASDEVANEHTSNGHQENGCEENGGNKARKGEKVGENGESPQLPSKRTTCRYMAATESAKAKFRSSSNPKTRTTPETPESPAGSTQKRYSTGGNSGTATPVGKAAESPKTAFGSRKSNSFQNRRSPSPKPAVSKEKPRSVDISPARRNSLGGADGKRWRT